ncbi:hypothetical protein D3C76_1333730 [compost metagenome]
MTILKAHCSGQLDVYPVGLANLAYFSGDRHGAPDDQQVVDHPENTHRNGDNLVAGAADQTPDGKTQAGNVQQRQ